MFNIHGPLWLGALSTVWSLESWKDNFELNGDTLASLLPGFSLSEAYVLTYDQLLVNLFKIDALLATVWGDNWPQNVWGFFFSRNAQECLPCISEPGNRMFSHSYEKIGLSSYFIFLLSTYSDLWSHLISFLRLCMFCLRMSSLSFSQAYNSAQPDQSFHLKTFYPWAMESGWHCDNNFTDSECLSLFNATPELYENKLYPPEDLIILEFLYI